MKVNFKHVLATALIAGLATGGAAQVFADDSHGEHGDKKEANGCKGGCKGHKKDKKAAGKKKDKKAEAAAPAEKHE